MRIEFISNKVVWLCSVKKCKELCTWRWFSVMEKGFAFYIRTYINTYTVDMQCIHHDMKIMTMFVIEFHLLGWRK